MKINKRDFLYIAGSKHLISELPQGNICRERWIEYVENHKDIFMWYEETSAGKETMKNLKDLPEWVKERIQISLNKATAYTICKTLVKEPYYLIFGYENDRGYIKVHREMKVTIPVAELILDMAAFLDSKVVVNGTKFFESIDQLDA